MSSPATRASIAAVKSIRSLSLLPALLLACCSDGDSSSQSSANPGFVPFSERINADQQRGTSALSADANGVWKPENNKRSSLESERQSPYFKGKYEGKTYAAAEFDKKSWWGNKEYSPPAYAGNTDGSRFASTSRLQGQGAREGAGKEFGTAGYATSGYSTSSAREASGNRIERNSDPYTENRRQSFGPPAMVDWQQQRSLSMGQTKGLTGR
jgi:hypothetical protein